MTDKTIKKILAGLLFFNMLMAGAFSLLRLANPTKAFVENNGQSAKPAPWDQGRAAESIDLPKLHFVIRPPATSWTVESSTATLSPERGDEIVKIAADESAALDQLRDWARKDPESALAWGQQQTNNFERYEALADACFQIAGSDPQRAVTLAEQFQLNGEAVLGNLAQQWAMKDLTAAQNWIAAQPAGEQRDALATGLAFIWSKSEPVQAAQFVVQKISPGTVQDEAVIMVLDQWAQKDAAGADSWVLQFPEGALRDRALRELTGLAQYKPTSPL